MEWLIAQGEGYNLEFKESFSQNIAREMCAFANANGGQIFIGVSDNGTIKGVRQENDLISRVQDIARNTDPPVTISMEYVDNVLVVDVSEGTDKPHSSNGKFYMRFGPNTQQSILINPCVSVCK